MRFLGLLLAAALAASRAEPLTAAPLPNSSPRLSVLRQVTPGQCDWLFLSGPALKASVKIATLADDCRGGRASYSQSKKSGAIWMTPSTTDYDFAFQGYPKPAFVDPTAKARPGYVLWAVATPPTASIVKSVPQDAEDAGVRSDGHVIALTTEPLAAGLVPMKKKRADGTTVDVYTIQGKDYEFDGTEGLRALAHAFELMPNRQWHLIESQATTTGSDYARGASALDAFATIHAKEERRMIERLLDAKTDGEILHAIKHFAPAADDGNGRVVRTFPDVPGSELLVWQVSTEFVNDTGLVLLRRAGDKEFKPLAGLGYTVGDIVTITRRGPFLLIVTNNLKAHPRLYDLRRGKLLFGSDHDSGVEFEDSVTR